MRGLGFEQYLHRNFLKLLAASAGPGLYPDQARLCVESMLQDFPNARRCEVPSANLGPSAILGETLKQPEAFDMQASAAGRILETLQAVIDTYFSLQRARSQKARGYARLHTVSGRQMWVPGPALLLRDTSDIENLQKLHQHLKRVWALLRNISEPYALSTAPTALGELLGLYLKQYKRPCPLTPQHGFVDSEPLAFWGFRLTDLAGPDVAMNVLNQAIYDSQLLPCVWDDMRAQFAQYPDSEILIAPAIDAQASMVVTQAHACIGPRNDGATSPRESDSCVEFQFSTSPFTLAQSTLHLQENLSDPYWEYVQDAAQNWVVQVREGDGGGQADAHVALPKGVETYNFRRVISDNIAPETPHEEIRRRISKLPPETCVVTQKPFTSHVVAQYIAHGLAVTRHVPPAVSGTLRLSQKPTIEPEALAAALRHWGYIAGDEYIRPYDSEHNEDGVGPKRRERGEDLRNALSFTHLIGILRDFPRPVMNIQAHAAWTLFYALMAALIGESRHAMSLAGPAPWAYPPAEERRNLSRGHQCRSPIMPVSLNMLGAVAAPEQRHEILTNVYSYEPQFLARQLPRLARVFLFLNWGGGYGGYSWASIAYSAAELYNSIVAITDDPCVPHFQSLCSAMDRATNAVHNNGTVFNKLINPAIVRLCSTEPLHVLRGALAIHRAGLWPRWQATFSRVEMPEVPTDRNGGPLPEQLAPSEIHEHVCALWDENPDTFRHHHGTQCTEMPRIAVEVCFMTSTHRKARGSLWLPKASTSVPVRLREARLDNETQPSSVPMRLNMSIHFAALTPTELHVWGEFEQRPPPRAPRQCHFAVPSEREEAWHLWWQLMAHGMEFSTGTDYFTQRYVPINNTRLSKSYLGLKSRAHWLRFVEYLRERYPTPEAVWATTRNLSGAQIREMLQATATQSPGSEISEDGGEIDPCVFDEPDEPEEFPEEEQEEAV